MFIPTYFDVSILVLDSTAAPGALVGFQPQLNGLGNAQPGLWQNLPTTDFGARIMEAAVRELPVFRRFQKPTKLLASALE